MSACVLQNNVKKKTLFVKIVTKNAQNFFKIV